MGLDGAPKRIRIDFGTVFNPTPYLKLYENTLVGFRIAALLLGSTGTKCNAEQTIDRRKGLPRAKSRSW
jgi:hypothetical protein